VGPGRAPGRLRSRRTRLIAELATAQPPWPVSAPALTACIATASPAALREADAWATALAGERAYLLTQLAKLDSIRFVPGSSASFVLLDTGIADVRTRLHACGFAVRRGKTFPGVAPGWIRVAVRDVAVWDQFTLALREVASHA
jgi:histidinol-phosphate aminotransferase